MMKSAVEALHQADPSEAKTIAPPDGRAPRRRVSSIVSWLQSLLHPSAPVAPSLTRAPSEPPHAVVQDSDRGEDESQPLIAHVAEVLEIPLEAIPKDEPEDERVELLAERLLTHFDEHRPGPDAFPTLALRVLNLVADPNVRATDLAQLISKDPALSAAILKIANSATYSRDFEVRSVRDAIVRMGLNHLAQTAGALAARTLFNPRTRAENAMMGPRWASLFNDSTVIAIQASAVAMRIPGAHSDQAFLGGLLHDVGKSIALRSLASLMVDGVVSKDLPERVIDSVLDRVHLLIGGEVHQEWSLPQYLTVLCVRHHDEFVPLEPDTVDLHVVRLVSGLHLWRNHPLRHRTAPYELAQSAEALGVDVYQIRSFAADLRQVRLQVATSLAG